MHRRSRCSLLTSTRYFIALWFCRNYHAHTCKCKNLYSICSTLLDNINIIVTLALYEVNLRFIIALQHGIAVQSALLTRQSVCMC